MNLQKNSGLLLLIRWLLLLAFQFNYKGRSKVVFHKGFFRVGSKPLNIILPELELYLGLYVPEDLKNTYLERKT